jgi:hypothetical protein
VGGYHGVGTGFGSVSLITGILINCYRIKVCRFRTHTYLYSYCRLSLRHLNPIQRSTGNIKDGYGLALLLFMPFFLSAHLCGGWLVVWRVGGGVVP